ncbi:carboxymuconolactone decarboxylase family protein [Streptomyces sp. NPDC090493]|uniref:carboxymuconolactone decarboxylase family protein n=1 Tax=Streptomyces sp. NPDC090493 TaxID=3365964 RepID=UPI003815DAEF
MSIDLPPIAEADRDTYNWFPTNLVRMMLRTKSVAKPYLQLGITFRDTYIDARTRESVIVRVGGLAGSAYELMQHRDIAVSVGIPEQTVTRLSDPTIGSFGDDRLDALTAFVDASVGSIGKTGEAPLKRLRQHYTDNEVAEIAMLIGHYVMTAIFLNAMEVPLDDGPGVWPTT